MNVKDILKDKKIKITKARVNILNIIINNEDSISAEDIYSSLRNNSINIDLSTVYRTLELFEQKDILEKFDKGKGKYNYLYKGKTHTHRVKCKFCKKEVEIDCPMPRIREMVKDQTGFTLVEEDISFNGICEECIDKIDNEN